MKHVLLISIVALVGLNACGSKSGQLKARPMGVSQQTPGSEKPTNPDDQVIGVVNMPEKADNRKMSANNNAIRNVYVGEAGFQTTVFCTADVTKSVTEKERIKLQGQSQIMLRQILIPNPDSDKNVMNPKDHNVKELVSLTCMAKSATLRTDAKNLTVVKLEVGKTTEVTGKFSTMIADAEFKTIVGCVTSKDMGQADKVLLADEADSKRVDILMAANSKMLFETTEKTKNVAEYILLTCDEAAPAK